MNDTHNAPLIAIRFEDHGQDFLEWLIEKTGLVVYCSPFQADVWCGAMVQHPESLKKGSIVRVVLKGGDGTIKTIRKIPVESIGREVIDESTGKKTIKWLES